MSKSFSLRRWLGQFRRQPIVKTHHETDKIFCRLALETLEDRLPTGDLLGAALPHILNLFPQPAHPGVMVPVPAKTVVVSAPAAKTPATPEPVRSTTSSGSAPAAQASLDTDVSASLPATPTKPPSSSETLQPATPSTPGISDNNPLLGSDGASGGQGTSNPTGAHPGTPSGPSGGSSGNSGGSSGGAGGGGSSPSNGQMVHVTAVLNAGGDNVAGKVTNDKQPIIAGTAAADSSVSVFADGHKIGTVKADSNGAWSIEAPSPLANGRHSFSAAPAGKSGGSAGLMTTIYTKPPKVTVSAVEFADSQVAPAVSVKVSNAPYGYDSTIHYDVDLNGDGNFNGKGETNYLEGGLSETMWNLPQGTYSIRVRVVDAAGNVGVGKATMDVDPYAGYVGDQNLWELYTGWSNSPYKTDANLMPGAWGIVPETGQDISNGGSIAPGAGSGLGSGGNLGMPGGTGGLFGPGTNGPDPTKIFFIDNQNRVLIDARVTLMKYYKVFQQELTNLGMTITQLTPASNMVTGYFPINQIGQLNNLPHFTAAVAELRPILETGSVESEGDGVILGPEFRASEGVTGAGVKVGVLSDSVNEFGGGLAQSVASGNLPSNVQVLQDDPSGTGTDEGRAMLEIVHDVAPGASLAFATGDASDPGFAANILALAKAGANVIADDLAYINEPMFSVGRIGQAVEQVFSQGVVYTSAAGNQGNMGYRAAWNGITATVGGTKGTYQDFGGGTVLQSFTLAPGNSISLGFSWDAAYLEGGSALANFQVPNNLIVDVVDTVNGTVLQQFNTSAQNTDEAFQDVEFTNGSTDSQLAFAFQLTKGPAPQAIGWILQNVFDANGNQLNIDINALNEGASTMQGQKLANASLTVGAVPWFDPTEPESYSALGGGVQIYSDPSGNRFSADTFINKPNVMAPDGVTVSFPLDGSPQFFGTSAAVPHAAGAAALLLQEAPTATPAEIDNHLGLTAEPLLTGGFNAETGDGLIQLSPLQLNPPGSAPYEPNDTSDTAFNFGTIGTEKLAINAFIGDSPTGFADYDWYVFTAGVTGTPVILMDNQNLEVHLFSFSAGDVTDFLTEQGNPITTPFAIVEVPPSSNPSIIQVGSGTTFAAGSLVYVEVKGSPTGPDSWTTGAYDLVLSMKAS